MFTHLSNETSEDSYTKAVFKLNLTEIEYPICHEKEWAFHAAYERKLIIQGHNKKKNYVQLTEKKLYKMQYIIKKKKLPEIEELKKEIKQKSIKVIIQKHPDLKEIIKNLNEIEEEIKQWGTLTVS